LASKVEFVQSAQALALQLADDRDPEPPAPSSLNERVASALVDVDGSFAAHFRAVPMRGMEGGPPSPELTG